MSAALLAAWIALGLLALLAIPVEMEFSLRRGAELSRVKCTLHWFFSIVRVSLLPKQSKKTVEPGNGEKRSKKRPATHFVRLLQTEGFVSSVLRLVRRMIRYIRVRELKLNARLGLDDPADTGRLWGALGSLYAMMHLPASAYVAIEPDFMEEIFEIDANGVIRVVPLQLLAVLFMLAMSPDTLRVVRALGSRST